MGVVAFFLLNGSSSGGVPVYPGATELQVEGMTFEQALTEVGEQLPQGWSGNMYQTTANTITMMDWYKNNMPGWTKTYDNLIIESSDFAMGYLGFIKQSDGAFIIAVDVVVDALENHYLVTMNGPASAMEDLLMGN